MPPHLTKTRLAASGLCRALMVLVAFSGFTPACASGLHAGVARAVLPDATGCELPGFSGVKRIATGMHDPLQARVLVLRSATASLALVACDLHSFSSKRIAEEAKRRLRIDLVLLACSGSHSAPAMTSRWPGHEAWTRQVEGAILDAIGKANASTFSAKLGSAALPVDLGYNWRFLDEYGKLTMLWRNAGRRPVGPLANTAGVWRIDDDKGVMRAVLFHIGCRASVLGRGNRQISADYPGFAASRVESELGSGVVSLFFQGASGNVVPYANEWAFRDAEDMGDTLGREVARTARTVSTRVEPDPALRILRTQTTFHERWGSKRAVLAETATIVVNRTLALAAIPGAPFAEHQIALADRSPVPGTLLLGHAFTENSEWLGILPTIRGAAEGGYGASGGETFLEVGAGEAMVDTALADIYHALGRLVDLPRGDLGRKTPPEGKQR